MESLVVFLLLISAVAAMSPPAPFPGLDSAVCTLESDPGRCRALMLRFFFDTDKSSCRPFYYGGCGGNGNNFDSMEACMEVCHTLTETPTTESPTTPPLPPTTTEEEILIIATAMPNRTSGWGPWGDWQRCYPLRQVAWPYPSALFNVHVCGPLSGEQKRRRRCLINGFCKGQHMQTRQCELRKCEPVYVFSNWSSCSTSCGKGWQRRTRSCSPPSPGGPSACGTPCVESRMCKVATCKAQRGPPPTGHMCSRHPCRNGGSCSPRGRAFLCICAEGFWGPICQFGTRPDIQPITVTAPETTQPACPVAVVRVEDDERPTTKEVETNDDERPTTKEVETKVSCPHPSKIEIMTNVIDCYANDFSPADMSDVNPPDEPSKCMRLLLRRFNKPKHWTCRWYNKPLRSVVDELFQQWCAYRNDSLFGFASRDSVSRSRLPRACIKKAKVLFHEGGSLMGKLGRDVQVAPKLPAAPKCLDHHFALSHIFGRLVDATTFALERYVVMPRYPVFWELVQEHKCPWQT